MHGNGSITTLVKISNYTAYLLVISRLVMGHIILKQNAIAALQGICLSSNEENEETEKKTYL